MTLKEYADHIRAEEGYGAMKAFAERAGMSYVQLAPILSGRNRNLKFDTLVRLMRASGGLVSRIEDFIVE